MWKTERRTIRENWGETLSLSKEGCALTVDDVVEGWRDDAAFRDVFIAELAATSFPAFFWELPPLTRATLTDPFECAVIRSDALSRMRADDSDFASHLNGAASGERIGKDAGDDPQPLLDQHIGPRRALGARAAGPLSEVLSVPTLCGGGVKACYSATPSRRAT
jgi:hypothetical protein